jgi:ABC-2 type transport system ATP-binding protein
VIVLAGGEIRFDGTPAALAATADGRVWMADDKDDGALIAWRTGDGRYRHVGDPPRGATAVDPTIDDAYLLMVGPAPAREGAAA